MTSLQLIDKQFEPVSPADPVSSALQFMQKFSCTHLPVVEGNLYKGLLDKRDIFDDEIKGDTLISKFTNDLLPASVDGSSNFLSAVPVSNIFRTDVVPVINRSEEYLGAITSLDLVNALGNYCGAGEYGALIVLQIEKSRLNISELNSIFESDGATILHYNISPIAATQIMEVSIGIDKKEISTILATLNQYNYKILFSSGVDDMETELSDNYHNLMNYLDM